MSAPHTTHTTTTRLHTSSSSSSTLVYYHPHHSIVFSVNHITLVQQQNRIQLLSHGEDLVGSSPLVPVSFATCFGSAPYECWGTFLLSSIVDVFFTCPAVSAATRLLPTVTIFRESIQALTTTQFTHAVSIIAPAPGWIALPSTVATTEPLVGVLPAI